MKRFIGFAVLVLGTTVLYGQTLDSAIRDAATEISGRLPQGSSVAVISFQSVSERLIDYTIDELNARLANTGRVTAVERRRLDTIRRELNFSMGGEVSDESAQSIGRMLGAQYIIMGSIETIGSQYRLRFQTITTEAAAIVYVFTQNIRSDSTLQSLLQGTGFLADYTPGQRAGTAALNLVLGAGSFFVMRDGKGGALTAVLEGLGAGVMLATLGGYRAFLSDWDEDDYDFGPKPTGMFDVSSEGIYFGMLLIGGAVLYGSGAIYGITRAMKYHKPGSQVTMADPPPFNIALVPDRRGNAAVQLSYTLKF